MKKTYSYVVLKGEEKNYIGLVPQLPGVVGQADSKEILDQRMKDAIYAYLDTIHSQKLTLPEEYNLLDVKQLEINYEQE